MFPMHVCIEIIRILNLFKLFLTRQLFWTLLYIAEVSTLFLESYPPTDFSSNPNQAHLKQLIKVLKATCKLQTGVLEQGFNWNLQDSSSLGAGLEIPGI